jgi:hypothetical protein
MKTRVAVFMLNAALWRQNLTELAAAVPAEGQIEVHPAAPLARYEEL